MSRPLEIAEERLAKGEIQMEEFEAIKAQLQRNSDISNNTPPQSLGTEAPLITKNGAMIWVVLGVFCLIGSTAWDVNSTAWNLASLSALACIFTGGVKHFFGK